MSLKLVRLSGLIASAVIGTALTTGSAVANEWHLAYAHSEDDVRGLRAGYRWTDLPYRMPDWLGRPELQVETSLNYWQYNADHSENLAAVTLSPLLQWQFTEGSEPIFFEFGVGAALMDDTAIADRDLSTHFQFEDRLAVSWQYNQETDARVSLTLSHYSNLDFEHPNDGLDFISLRWERPF
ncbi:hypothetical protein IDSA_00885 [Pseudidiomarina salinarum]|uniref:Lipid A deacylase n=1 Tax=Pseudidiomarina salinarum TaxID=435908 RepID=A0A094IUG9_9GAMM|nr:acyloxyacyl hydrolase [Pseudidiomarina salinarum]KFZ31320.1 hypothetical protein IDSA_00885 [Pseudidiomarina salinarum]RUO70927.1 acyloxyacyl hydrolase [Pseudidiomarina salinarum]